MDIAIIGMATRAPGARSVDELWRNLEAGRESISRLSIEELTQTGVDPAVLADPRYVPAAPLLEDCDRFDAAFFGYTPREATSIDPQHRVLLECAWHALEHAGYDPQRCGHATGVFAGASMNTYLLYSGQLPQLTRDWVLTLSASDKDFLATRISFKLNLQGPSLTIQTACSTSLVAVHVACQSLRLGECDMAIAGGVSVKVPQKIGYLAQAGAMFSADGHVRAFDAKATGTVFGSGAGLVVLKPLADAVRDRDVVYAIIRGSAVNNDGGAKASFTAPSVHRQADVVVEALANAGIEPETVSYIETHGTGTPIGDPIEVAALTAAFRSGTEKTEFCALGSVKTNLGHLEAAAGVIGLIKAALALHHRWIPATLHYETPNPEIDFPSSPFFVAARGGAWPAGSTPRRAGVSALGVGGTNVHVVLEESAPQPSSGRPRSHELLVISARTESALAAIRSELIGWLERDLDLADVAHTLQVGRKRFDVRHAIVCRDRADAIAQLAALGPPHKAARGPARPIAFRCSRSPRDWTAEATLFETEPVFRAAIAARAQLDATVWTDPDARRRSIEHLGLPRFTALSSVIAQLAYAALWEAWGIRPDRVVGDDLVARCLADRATIDRELASLAEATATTELPEAALVIELASATTEGMLRTLGELWMHGVEIEWDGVQRDRFARRVALPTYPFERKRFWFEG